MYCQSQKNMNTSKSHIVQNYYQIEKIVVLSDARHFDGGYHKDQIIVSHFLIIDWGKENTEGKCNKKFRIQKIRYVLNSEIRSSLPFLLKKKF